MRERDVERYFCRQVEARGGWPIKFSSPAQRGLPDRIVIWPDGTVWFVEIKAPGGILRPQQHAVIRRLRERRQSCFIVDSREAVDYLFQLEDS